MQNWIVASLLLLGGAFVFRSDFSAIFNQKSDDLWLGYIALIISGIFIGHIMRLTWRRIPSNWRSSVVAICLLSVFGLVEFRDEISNVFKGYERTNFPLAALATTESESEIRRSWDGHFRTIAEIDDANIGVLVDTGASLILLRYDDAEQVGIDMDSLEYSLPITTASGQTFVAPVVFGTVRVGSVEVPRVRGAVARPGELHSSLLGMSFLEDLREVVIRKDRLTLRN